MIVIVIEGGSKDLIITIIVKLAYKELLIHFPTIIIMASRF